MAENVENGSDPVLVMVEEMLATFTYKPGWAFVLEPCADNSWLVRMIWESSDSRSPTRKTTVVQVWHLPPLNRGRSKSELQRMLRREIHMAEKHEADEFMLFNGERLFDPHKKV